jgi:hypothetical protein
MRLSDQDCATVDVVESMQGCQTHGLKFYRQVKTRAVKLDSFKRVCGDCVSLRGFDWPLRDVKLAK